MHAVLPLSTERNGPEPLFLSVIVSTLCALESEFRVAQYIPSVSAHIRVTQRYG